VFHVDLRVAFQKRETLHWMHTQNNRLQFLRECIGEYLSKITLGPGSQ
jgi:hypothetical protein